MVRGGDGMMVRGGLLWDSAGIAGNAVPDAAT